MEKYKYQVACLVRRLEEIITEHSLNNKVKCSELIMKELRKEYILLPLEYINSFLYTKDQLSSLMKMPLSLDFINSCDEDSRKLHQRLLGYYQNSLNSLLGNLLFNKEVTLDPSKIVDENYANNTIIIRGNSFGPFNPKEYFKPENVKILWLLKESYITKDSWIKGDRGGHNQAKENRLWSDIVDEDNSTLKNLIHITQTILTKLDNNEIQPSEQETMNHICILEVDYFPGLYFNSPHSKDSSMNYWGKFNQSLIKVLIEFYEPNIIVFGHTLEYFKEWGDFDNYKKVFSRYKQANLIILNDTISEWTYIHNEEDREVMIDTAGISSLSENEIINVGKNLKYLGKSGRIYIQADHPSKGYKQILLDIDATRIKNWFYPDK